MAFCFGSSPEVAGFIVAYRLANLFRRVLGEGNAQAGFIPRFEELRQKGEKIAFLFYRDVIWSSGLFLAFVGFLLMWFFFGLRESVGEGWGSIFRLACLMTPSLFFIGLYALQAGLLQCQKKTFWAAFAPVFFNLSWVAAALFAWKRKEPMELLAVGITAAYGVQWIAVGWQTKKEWSGILSAKDWLKPRLFSLEWRSILRPMGLGIFGVAATQINSALDVIFARFSDPSGPAYLSYAIRVQQLPLALFGIALSGTLLAPLTKARLVEGQEKSKELLEKAIFYGLSLMVPCTFALLALGPSGLNLLYGRGGFHEGAIEETVWCLWGYGLGLLPSVLVLLLAQGYYAKKAYFVPTVASLVAVLLNIALNGWLVFVLKWGALSVALATSASTWLQYAILCRCLHLSPFWKTAHFWKLSGSCFVSAATCLSVEWFQMEWLTRSLGAQIGQFTILTLLYALLAETLLRSIKGGSLFTIDLLRN